MGGEGEAGDGVILADFLAFAKLAVKNKVGGWMMRRGSDDAEDYVPSGRGKRLLLSARRGCGCDAHDEGGRC